MLKYGCFVTECQGNFKKKKKNSLHQAVLDVSLHSFQVILHLQETLLHITLDRDRKAVHRIQTDQ